MSDSYIRRVTEAVHLNDDAIGVPHSTYTGYYNSDMLLFRDADGECFGAAWRGDLVIDEAPFEER